MIISYKAMTSGAQNSLCDSQWKDWQHRNADFLCIFSWFSMTIPNPSFWYFGQETGVSHQMWDWCYLSCYTSSAPPSHKMVDGCHRSEKLLKKLPRWREKRSEEVFLSSSAFVSGQVDPMKPLTFQRGGPMGKVPLTMLCNVQMWMSVGKYHTAYHLAEKFVWVSSNLFKAEMS